jgi:Uma2 family endonuclease
LATSASEIPREIVTASFLHRVWGVRALIARGSRGKMSWNMAFDVPMRSADELEYPSSDGQPMAETSVHAEAMADAFFVLDQHFRERADVNVGMNLLFYYEKGNAGARFSPDVYVSIGAPKGPRRVYKMWEEPVPPTVVFEMSSRGTWLEDAGNKKAICQKFGVAEYFLFDPEAEYLDPPLQGFRLAAGEYVPIAPNEQGLVVSARLGLGLRAEIPRLRFVELGTGALVPFADELGAKLLVALSRADEAEASASDARARARDAEARLVAAEAELARLRAKKDD